MTVRSRRLVYGGAACVSLCVGWVVLQGWSVPAELPRDRDGVGAAAKASPAPPLARASSGSSSSSSGSSGAAESSSSSESATAADTVAPSRVQRAAGTALPAVPRIGCGAGGHVGSLSGKEYCRLLDEAVWAEIEEDDAATASDDRPRRLLASQALKRLLKKQHRLHRLVAQGREPEGQRYLVWSLSGGVGNRMESLVSTFLAAMLSGRVLLVKDWFAKTQKKGKPMPKEYHNGMLLEVLEAAASSVPHNSEILCESLPMMHLRDFRAAYPHHFAAEARKEHIKVDIVGKHDKHYTKWSKLACAHPTEFPSPDVKFTYLWTNQYYLPLFWANPTVRGTMQELFPDGDAFGPLSRFLLRPNQVVEAVVEKFVCTHAQGKPGRASAGSFLTRQDPSFTNLVGLQMRAFRPNKMVEMAKDFDACLARQPARREAATYFVASLHKPMRDYFTKKYRGRVVALDTEARGEQETGSVSGDVEALANILILGRTADFLVSPGSTFGSFAAGYYSRLPVQMHTMGSGGACTRLASADPCFISWLRVDKLLQRMSDAAGPFPCRPEPVPEAATANCAAHLSVPFKK
eukprot:Rhum_TRINITY_DN8310_c0_g1::Rhum_TRINITY_DN8310_c0_g1_i1::g.27268::m.27268/K13681/FUT; xyloglucan fucosyltransferase